MRKKSFTEKDNRKHRSSPQQLQLAPPDSIAPTDTLRDTLRLKTTGDPLEHPIIYSCTDSIVIDLASGSILLYGAARAKYGNITLEADTVEYSWEASILDARAQRDSLGRVRKQAKFNEGTQDFQADRIRYNFRSGKGKIYRILSGKSDGIIRSEEAKKDEFNNIYAKRAIYTTCDHDPPHYWIEANPVKIIPDKLMVCRAANVRIEGVRTPLALPFALFPIQQGQRSGILLPEYGRSSRYGFSLNNGGYYFGLSEFFDLELRGDIYTSGSWQTSLRTNFRKRYRYNGHFDFRYSNLRTGDELDQSLSIQRLFKVSSRLNVDPKAIPNVTLSADIGFASSDYNQLVTTDVTSHLSNSYTSSVSFSKRFPGTPFTLSAALRHFQNTQTHAVDLSLPEARLSASRLTPFKRKGGGRKKWFEKITLTYGMDFRNSLNTVDSLFFSPQTFSQFKTGLRHNVSTGADWKLLKHFNLRPSANYFETWYTKQIAKEYIPKMGMDSGFVRTDTTKKFTTNRYYDFDLSVNTKIYSRLNFKRGKLKVIRHEMRPSIGASYRPDFSDPEFDYYRDVQVDEAGNTEQYSRFPTGSGYFGLPPTGKQAGISMSVSNDLQAKVYSAKDTIKHEKKIRLIDNFLVSSFYNVAKDSLKLSPIQLSAYTQLLDKVTLRFSGRLDPYVQGPDGTGNLDRFEFAENRRPGRLETVSVSASAAFRDDEGVPGIVPYAWDLREFRPYGIPWQLNLGYSLSIERSNPADTVIIAQSLQFGGQLSIDGTWRIDVQSGFDFDALKLTYSSINISRDLHCWEMYFNWIPIGNTKGYRFGLNVKSSLLRDLKIEKKSETIYSGF